jgi:hypothetical protein
LRCSRARSASSSCEQPRSSRNLRVVEPNRDFTERMVKEPDSTWEGREAGESEMIRVLTAVSGSDE